MIPLQEDTNFKCFFSKDSDKFLKRKFKNDKQSYNRLLLKIEEIIKNPCSFELLSTQFKGYRKARVGKYRIIFKIYSNHNCIYIFKIGSRENFYN